MIDSYHQNPNPNLNYHTDMSNINSYPNFNLNLKLECRTLSPPSGGESEGRAGNNRYVLMVHQDLSQYA